MDRPSVRIGRLVETLARAIHVAHQRGIVHRDPRPTRRQLLDRPVLAERGEQSRYRASHSVGGKKPNAWGLYDMYGNVWDTCYIWQDSQGRPVDPVHLRPGPGPLDKTFYVGGSYGDSEPDPAYHSRD